ncbi:hypothetical protein C7S15_7240 [Burkholderia cepacia]|nr:hypothetical protein [Burkholderia cepacia]
MEGGFRHGSPWRNCVSETIETHLLSYEMCCPHVSSGLAGSGACRA